MDARYGFLWGSDPDTWDWQLLRILVIARGGYPPKGGWMRLDHLPRRSQGAAALRCGRNGLRLQRHDSHWEVTL